MGILVETAWLHPLLHLLLNLFHLRLTALFFVFASISLPCNMSSVSFFGVVTSVGKGQGQTAPPQIPPPKPREPRGQGVNSTRAGPGGPLLGKKTWPELRGRSKGAEDVKITASIISCCQWPAPPPLFRFYELAKRWLRLFSSWWLIKFGPSNVNWILEDFSSFFAGKYCFHFALTNLIG